MRRMLVRVGLLLPVLLLADPVLAHPQKPGRRPRPAPALERPNIIVVYTDDQRSDTLHVMPAVSRLAQEGAFFTNSFVTTPVCGPSRASLLTGRLVSTQGIDRNEGASGQFDPSDTIAVRLQRRGYTTALFGKYMNGYRAQFPAVPPGWSEWRAMRDRIGADLFKPGSLYVDPVLSWDGEERQEFGYSTDLLAEYALDFIERNAHRPFFLLLSFWAPHVPLTPAERHRDLLEGHAPEKPPSFEEERISDKPAWVRDVAGTVDFDPIWDNAWPRYLEVLLSVDEAVADIRAKLEELGLDENTIIVFTSDNGLLVGEHWILGKGVPYEESIRVPLVVWSPRIGRRRIPEIALNIDIAPTLAELAGSGIHADGRSLLPLLRGEKRRWRRSFEIEWPEGLGLPQAYQAFRSRLFKLILWQGGHRELYFLPLDPFEEHSLAPPHGPRPRGDGR